MVLTPSSSIQPSSRNRDRKLPIWGAAGAGFSLWRVPSARPLAAPSTCDDGPLFQERAAEANGDSWITPAREMQTPLTVLRGKSGGDAAEGENDSQMHRAMPHRQPGAGMELLRSTLTRSLLALTVVTEDRHGARAAGARIAAIAGGRSPCRGVALLAEDRQDHPSRVMQCRRRRLSLNSDDGQWPQLGP